MQYSIHALLIGAGATLVMDLWGIARTRLLHVPSMSYGLVGRLNSLLTHAIYGLGL
jgi:DUF2938 family protein